MPLVCRSRLTLYCGIMAVSLTPPSTQGHIFYYYCLSLLFIPAKPESPRLSFKIIGRSPKRSLFRNSGDASGNAFFAKRKKEHAAISGIHGWELAPKFPHKLLDFFGSFLCQDKKEQTNGNGKKNIHETCIMDSGSSPELDRASRKCPVDLFSERASGRAGFLKGGVVANPPSVRCRSQPPPFNSREEPFPIRSYQTPSGAARKSAPQL